MDDVKKAALSFRALVEAAPKGGLPISLQNFPNGACGDTTLLLGRYLAELGHGEFRYYLGRRDGRSHAWLQRGPLIVDITADQFDDFEAPVFVADDSPWHGGFAGEDQHAADPTVFGEPTTSSLAAAYTLIVGNTHDSARARRLSD
jgi:hypothetical protein